MVNYTCDACQTTFAQKKRYDTHSCETRPCKEKVRKSKKKELEPNMDYALKTRDELIRICKDKGIKGYSGKKKDAILELLHEKQDTGKFRTNMKDQFYTSEQVAKTCIQDIMRLCPFTSSYLWVEPSAGNGSFLHHIPPAFKKIGIDLDPKAKDILQHDYLTWEPPVTDDIIVYGNPPFGRQSSLAKSFISKSCKFAKIIAFILPKSFTKQSMINAFSLKFHLILSVELEKDSFVINGDKHDVPCVFQIWQKMDTDRKVEDKVKPDGFDYVKSNEPYHIAFRRVGGLAGKCYKKDSSEFSVQSHYFIKFNNTKNMDAIIEKINKHTFPSNTVGPRSLAKHEVNSVVNAIINKM
jgi:hypothetical protein